MVKSELQYLENVWSDLRVSPCGSISLGQETHGTFSQAGQTALPDAEIIKRLADLFYVNVYARRYAGIPQGPFHRHGEDISQSLSASNAGKSCCQAGWTVAVVHNNGSIEAERNSKKLTLLPGHYLVDGGAHIRTGAAVTASRPKEFYGGNGFYFALGNALPSDDDRLARIYFNVGVENAPALTNLLTTQLNDIGLPFRFKVSANAGMFDRCDSAVLYIAKRHFHAFSVMAGCLLPKLTEMLRDETPLFAKRLARGLSVAEEPGCGKSFGQVRTVMLAESFFSTWKSGAASVGSWIESLKIAFEQQGASLATPHLTRSLVDRYILYET